MIFVKKATLQMRSRAQRCLFGRSTDQDRQSERDKANTYMEECEAKKCEEYNFDFSNGTPLHGENYEWKLVTRRAPLQIDSVSVTPKGPRHDKRFITKQQQQQPDFVVNKFSPKTNSTNEPSEGSPTNRDTWRYEHLQEEREKNERKKEKSDTTTAQTQELMTTKSSVESPDEISKKKVRNRSVITDYYPIKRQRTT